MKGVSAAVPMPPIGPRPISGMADPSEPTRKRTAATINPALRPNRLAIGPPTAAPITQPSKAQDTAQPERLSRAASERLRGLMKL